MLRSIIKKLQYGALAVSISACTVGSAPVPYVHPVDNFPMSVGTYCGDELTYLLGDPDNCGDCGIVCDDYGECIGGSCMYPEFLDNPCETDEDCVEGLCIDNYCKISERIGCEFESCPDDLDCISAYCSKVTIEVCDGNDNDRDGTVDEDVTRPFYSGPKGTRNVGSCRDGIEHCIAGGWYEREADVLPVPEESILLCDGQDNDCDGCADPNPITGGCSDVEQINYDIVFIMDMSGSMYDEIFASRAAVQRLAGMFRGNDHYQFALMHVPYDPVRGIRSAVKSDFTGYEEFVAAVLRHNVIGVPIGSIEQTYDIIYLLETDGYPNLSFREGAQRRYVLFTDEIGQSYRFSPLVSEELICAVLPTNTRIIVITKPEFYSSWDLCAYLIELGGDTDSIAENFQTAFDSECE